MLGPYTIGNFTAFIEPNAFQRQGDAIRQFHGLPAFGFRDFAL